MGLDNGIIARKTNIEEIDAKLRALSTYVYNNGDFEIAYWRKCWNVRDAIIDSLDYFTDNCGSEVSHAELTSIITVLEGFNAENWEEEGNGGSIWEWDEIEESMKDCIERLNELSNLMAQYPEIIVEFYDSY